MLIQQKKVVKIGTEADEDFFEATSYDSIGKFKLTQFKHLPGTTFATVATFVITTFDRLGVELGLVEVLVLLLLQRLLVVVHLEGLLGALAVAPGQDAQVGRRRHGRVRQGLARTAQQRTAVLRLGNVH